MTFTQAGRDVLRDQGQRLEVLDPGSDEAIVAGLLLAQQMYGNTLTLTGPAEFQARVVALSVERGLPIKFADPQLEAQRVQLRQQRSLAEFEKQTTKVIKDFKAEKRAELDKAKETLEKQTTEAMAAEKQRRRPYEKCLQQIQKRPWRCFGEAQGVAMVQCAASLCG